MLIEKRLMDGEKDGFSGKYIAKIFSLNKFSNEVATAVEVYLELFQTYMIELSCENSKRFLARNSKKAPS